MVISRPKVLTAFMLEYIDRLEDRGIEIEDDGGLNAITEVEISIEGKPAVPQADLKKYLDCSSESIRRIMVEFEEQGIVEQVEGGSYRGSKTFTLSDEPANSVMSLFD